MRFQTTLSASTLGGVVQSIQLSVDPHQQNGSWLEPTLAIDGVVDHASLDAGSSK